MLNDMMDMAEERSEPMGEDALDDRELLRIIDEEIESAKQYTDVITGAERDKAMQAYLRRPMGNERAGRSRVISGEVFKVVEGLTTAVANIFAVEKSPVEFSARNADDVDKAKEKTIVVNYVISNRTNGELARLEAIKDGLLLKTGFVTWGWRNVSTATREVYKNQTQDSIALMQQDDNVEIISQEEAEPYTPDPMLMPDGSLQQQPPVPLWNVEIKVISRDGEPFLETIPPEEMLVSPSARSCDVTKVPFIAHRAYKTRDDLRNDGYDDDTIEALSFSESRLFEGEAQVIRRKDETTDGAYLNGRALIYRCWLKVDYDGDGVPELRCIDKHEGFILKNEIVDEIPIAAWCPNPQPHEFFGRCPADEAIESQELKTVLLRQELDKIYHANNPMWRVSPGVDITPLLNPDFGQVFVADPLNAEPIVLNSPQTHSMDLLEYATSDQENLTGFTRYSQGMDAKSLNDTATGVRIITNMSQERVKFIAGQFGLAWAKAMRGISKVLSQNCDKEMQIRLSNSYKTVDPREWHDEYDMTVNVGLGIVDRDAQLQHKMQISLQHQNVMASGGGMLVTPVNRFNLLSDIAELAGEKDPHRYWADPKNNPNLDPKTGMPLHPPPPPLNPHIESAKIQSQADLQKHQMSLGLDEKKAAADYQLEQQKLRAQIEKEVQIAMIKEQAKHQTTVYQTDAMSRPATNINMDAQEPLNNLIAVMQQTNAETLAAISQSSMATAEAIRTLAEAMAMPKQATLSNGKTIIVQSIQATPQ